MFETNLRDERFLPFEGAGVESTWKLELPSDYRAFDYTTIADVIMHVRYTSRPGIEPSTVTGALADLFKEASQANLALLFSLQHDFPTEWWAFVNGSGDFQATIRRNHFPYFTQGKTVAIAALDLYGQDVTKHHTVGDPEAATTDLTDHQAFTFTAAPDASGLTQVLIRSSNTEIFLVVRYSL